MQVTVTEEWKQFTGAATYTLVANYGLGAGRRSQVHYESGLITERAARLRVSNYALCVGSTFACILASVSGTSTTALLGRCVLPAGTGLALISLQGWCPESSTLWAQML